ncbi:MAG: nitroreductase family protein [Eggerthellaceae bacterium]|nr:nitroreductase family protein [Eggerthellaceae bacterium]
MNTLETLFSRKSVRSYTGAPVPDDALGAVLKAAMAAPVGMGQYQDVHLTVVTDVAVLRGIEEAACAFMNRPDAHPLYGAPALIVVSARDEAERGGITYENCAVVAHNMALAATELGMGSCFIFGALMPMRQSPELRAPLGLPDGFSPRCGIVLGETAETWEERAIPADRIGVDRI